RLVLPSTLFPYTTLFRSALDLQCPHQARLRIQAAQREIQMSRIVADADLRLLRRWLPLVGEAAHLRRALPGRIIERAVNRGRRLDRKSTRLNSSHLVISY